MSLFLARSGRGDAVAACLLLGDERTWLGLGARSENDPQRTCRGKGVVSASVDEADIASTARGSPRSGAVSHRPLGKSTFIAVGTKSLWGSFARDWRIFPFQR